MTYQTRFYSIELEKDIADKLRTYLKEQEIEFETSQAGEFTHFEITTNKRGIKTAINQQLLKFELES